MENLNFLSLPATILLSLVATPLALRKAGYPTGKTVLGTLTVLAVLVAIWGVIANIQNKAGLGMLPLGWLIPATAAIAGWRLRDRL